MERSLKHTAILYGDNNDRMDVLKTVLKTVNKSDALNYIVKAYFEEHGQDLKLPGTSNARALETYFKIKDMIQLTFLGDKWIFLALSLIVLILLGMVFKYVFKPGPIGAVADATGKPANFNPSNNNHFLNSKRGNMHKISKIFVEKEGKHYVLIDMGNDMVLIMEEDSYEPEQRDASMMRNIENSANNVMDIEVNDAEEVGYLPEKKG